MQLQKMREEVDDYKDTIYAIIGFANLFRYDDHSKKMKDNILFLQGCKFYPEEQTGEGHEEKFVTPDIGILFPNEKAIVGEVKCSFPEDRNLWLDDFKQLMEYDKNLSGWPTENTKVLSYDIVLLLHFSRAVAVKKYYELKKGNEIVIHHPFCIVEFHRSNQAKEFFSLRIQYGTISDRTINDKLEEGIEVPMHIFINAYSSYKLYDVKPPLAYLLEILWTHIVALKASENPNFQSLRRNQKIEVILNPTEIKEALYQQFSFAQFLIKQGIDKKFIEAQPKYPMQVWINEACEKLVNAGDADWINNKQQIRIRFRRIDNIFEYFLHICSSESEDNQLVLFET